MERCDEYRRFAEACIELARHQKTPQERAVLLQMALIWPLCPRLVRQERLYGPPFIVGEFIAHDSRLQFGSLNHAPSGIINPPWPVMADANTSIYFRFWGYSRHGGTCCCPSPGRK